MASILHQAKQERQSTMDLVTKQRIQYSLASLVTTKG